MIKADFHLHSEFSSDSETPVEAVIETAIDKGLDVLCLTDHHDIDFPADKYKLTFILDLDSYYTRLCDLREQYKDKIDLRIGVELGLMPHLAKDVHEATTKYPFDFLIGSSHLVDYVDIYYPEYYEGRTEVEAYREYFQTIVDNAKNIKDYDVYGHLDYVTRYGPTQNKNFRFEDYEDIFREALKIIIDDGKGIEINTAGLKKGLGYPHPHIDILKCYKELGGEIITVGSDAHITENIAYGFDTVPDYLKAAGFEYYCVYKNRKPEFIKL